MYADGNFVDAILTLHLGTYFAMGHAKMPP